MAFTPISNTVPQYEENGVAASGYFIKFYESGTTTPTAMATDSTGTTLLDKCELNTEGYPINGSSAVFIPHINKKYKIALFRNATDADANDLASAAWPAVDGLLPALSEGDGQVDTIANLRLLKPSFDGQTVELLGHTLAGIGGGKFYYDPDDTTSTDNNATVVVTPDGQRWLRESAGFVTPEMFGAIPNSPTTDCSVAINLASAFGGQLKLMPVIYYISDTVRHYRGSRWDGAGTIDTAAKKGTVFKKIGDMKKPMYQTEAAGGHGGGQKTHYYGISNVVFDGNQVEQTEEHDAVQFWGAWIGSSMYNVFIYNHYGSGLTLNGGADVHVDRIWIQGIVTSGYAFDTNPNTAGPLKEGLFYGGQIYVENVSTIRGGDPRNDPSVRGKGIRIKDFVTFNLNDLHIEGCRRPVDIEGNQVLNIGKISAPHCGLSSDADSSIVRYLDSDMYTVNIESISGPTGNICNFFVGFAAGVSNGNLIPDYPITNDPRSGAYAALKTAGLAARGPRTAFSNNLSIERIGGAAVGSIDFRQEGAALEKHTVKQSGIGVALSATNAAGVETEFLKSAFYDTVANRLVCYQPLELGFTRGSDAQLPGGTLWRSSSAWSRGEGLFLRGASRSEAVVTSVFGFAVPTANADYVGQEFIDTVNRKVYKAVDIGTGASDWVVLN